MKVTKEGRITLLDTKTCYETVVIKMLCWWLSDREIEQWNRIEGPGIESHMYGTLIYVVDGIADPWRKERLLSKWS